MSHELRTPLNSLLILAKLLADNDEQNLTAKQVEYAKTIHSSGNDLLGADQPDPRSVQDRGRQDADRERTRSPLGRGARTTSSARFRQIAEQKGLEFEVRLEPRRRPTAITTDPQRLQQILKNLLSNAFKFTEHGTGGAAHRPGAGRDALRAARR